jgi:hypothetical protein
VEEMAGTFKIRKDSFDSILTKLLGTSPTSRRKHKRRIKKTELQKRRKARGLSR